MPLYSIYYVTRDIERALGMEPSEQYRIITNTGAYAESWQKKYPDYVFLIDRKAGDEPLDTYALLAHTETTKIIVNDTTVTKKLDSTYPAIIVFKNTSRIEAFCKKKNWKLLNPSAALADKIENKITQVTWLGEAEHYLPPHDISKVSDINTAVVKKSTSVQRPFILQWAHSHTGDGTILIPSGKQGEKILADLKEKFPDRECRVTEYINGPMFTANICVMSHIGKDSKKSDLSDPASNILISNVSYQITGMLPFTDNPFATVGNDWSLPHSLLSEKKIAEFNDIAVAVGQRMLASGWRGLFGIDCIYDEERDSLHLIEVNARQPASTTYESQLQAKVRQNIATTGMTIFEAHISALAEEKLTSIIEINDGAQIIDRIKINLSDSSRDTIQAIGNLQQKRYTVIEYKNTKLGADHIRIQSERGIMSAHNAFNSRGKEILTAVML
jgi:hypothetical protein